MRWRLRFSFGVLVLLLLSSCGTHKEVTAEKPVVVHEVSHDTLTLTKWRTDSVVFRDSVVVTQQGTDRWHTRYVMRQHTDTIIKVKVDSVPKVVTVTKTVTKKVQRKPHWWETALKWIGALAIIGGIISIILIRRE